MKPKLIIGNKNYSSWSLRSWLLIEKLQIDYEEIVVPLYTETHHEQLSRWSAAAKVPIYVDGDITIWDSMAIAGHLAESHPQLWPDEQKFRSHARSICAECHCGFVELRNALPMNCRAAERKIALSSEVLKDIQRIDTIWTECRSSKANYGSWLYGRFSVADAFYAPIVSRFLTYGIDQLSTYSKDYCEFLINDEDIRRWYQAAEAEPWTIEASEVGDT